MSHSSFFSSLFQNPLFRPPAKWYHEKQDKKVLSLEQKGFSMIHQSNFPPSIGQALAALAEFLTVHSISWESAMQSRDQIASPSPERQALFSLAFSFIAFARWLPDALLVFKNDEQKEIVYANPALVQLFECASLDEWLAYVNRSFPKSLRSKTAPGSETRSSAHPRLPHPLPTASGR